jgi:hypothetical protein
LKNQLAAGKVNLDDPATTIALLKLNAVVGVTAFANPDGSVKSMGIQCAFCHSTVDNSFAPGVGKRLDGWANRDLNVGAIVSLAPRTCLQLRELFTRTDRNQRWNAVLWWLSKSVVE